VLQSIRGIQRRTSILKTPSNPTVCLSFNRSRQVFRALSMLRIIPFLPRSSTYIMALPRVKVQHDSQDGPFAVAVYWQLSPSFVISD
jgi:hypothetical protein